MSRSSPASGAQYTANAHVSFAWAAFRQGTLDTLPSVLLRRPLPPSLPNRTLLDNSALVHANPARTQVQLVEVAIVVRDHHDGRTGFHQFRKELVIELAPKFGILFGCPFVQQENWALFKKTDDEREPPALTPGKIERAKLAVSQSGLICQTELVQQAINFARLRFGYSVKPLKQMIVEENPRRSEEHTSELQSLRH